MITSGEADEYKYCKNDYLIVSVWDIISKTFSTLNQPILTIKQLLDKLDDRVWNLFRDGLTCTLNQVDGDWATDLIKIYQPKSMEDVAKFVSAIRPSFDSLRNTFINRIEYSTGSEELDKLFESTEHMCLFQENIMQYFEWLGVSPSESIGLIKKISKKKIHQEDFDALEERIRQRWIENTGSDFGFNKSWEDMQTNMAYSFNSPHGVATALDCLYCAYLKVNYPLEYYSVVLNIYKDDVEKTNRLINELVHFGIKLSSIKFRYSNSQYGFDKDNNTIYKSVSSIKFLNDAIADELYELRDKKYSSFINLMGDISKTSINSKQLDILIRLNYFSEFGHPHQLQSQVKIYADLSALHEKFKTCKQLSKLDCILPIDEVVECCGKQTEKQFREIDNDKLLQVFRKNYPTILKQISAKYPYAQTTTIDLMQYEVELLGYTDIKDASLPHDMYMITKLETNNWGTCFASLYQCNSGIQKTIKFGKIKRKPIYNNDLAQGNIVIVATDFKKKGRYDENHKWVESNEYEEIIISYAKIK
jgi:DNA polymerase III alpha subunit